MTRHLFPYQTSNRIRRSGCPHPDIELNTVEILVDIQRQTRMALT